METPPHQNFDALLNLNGRRTTRSALAEIPARLGMLTVAENHHQTTPLGMILNDLIIFTIFIVL